MGYFRAFGRRACHAVTCRANWQNTRITFREDGHLGNQHPQGFLVHPATRSGHLNDRQGASGFVNTLIVPGILARTTQHGVASDFNLFVKMTTTRAVLLTRYPNNALAKISCVPCAHALTSASAPAPGLLDQVSDVPALRPRISPATAATSFALWRSSRTSYGVNIREAGEAGSPVEEGDRGYGQIACVTASRSLEHASCRVHATPPCTGHEPTLRVPPVNTTVRPGR